MLDRAAFRRFRISLWITQAVLNNTQRCNIDSWITFVETVSLRMVIFIINKLQDERSLISASFRHEGQTSGALCHRSGLCQRNFFE